MPPQVQAPPQQSNDPSQFGEYSEWAQENMAKGATPQQLQQTLQQAGINPSQGQPQGQGQKPNFFEKLLPTAGGILGGIIGIPGDIFGGAGSIVGAGAGGALGQELENKLTGQKQNVLTSGAENAVGAGVGGALGQLGKLFAGRVVAPLAEKGATQLVAGQAPGVTKDLAEYVIKENGITDLNKAGQMADVLTGGAGGANTDVDGRAILNKYVEDTLANNGPKTVQVNDLAMSPLTGRNAAIGESVAGESNLLQQALTRNSLGGTPEANAIRTRISSIINSMGQNAQGAAEPMGALDAQRQIAKEASDAIGNYLEGGRKDITLKNMAQTYTDISNTLKSRLGLDKIPVSDEDKAALAADIQKFGAPVSKSAAQNVANEIQNTEGLTLGGVRTLESNWAQVKNVLQTAADQANKNFGTSTGQMARSTLPVAGSVAGIGGPRSILGTIGGMATSSPTADKAGASLLSTISKGASGKAAQQVLPLATRASVIAAANTPNIAASGAGAGGGMGPNDVSSGTGGAMQPGMSPITQVFDQLLQQENAAPASFASSLGPVLGSLAPLLQKQQLATGVAGNLEPAFAGAGGAQGLGGGLLSRISGMIPGTAANEYQRQQQATANSLAQLLGISPQAALQLTPQLMQGPQSAGIAGGNVSGILGALGAPAM